MNVIVESLTGKRMMFEVEPYDTICSLKQQISVREGININSVGLVLAGKPLVNDKKLSEYDIKNNDLFYLILVSKQKGG